MANLKDEYTDIKNKTHSVEHVIAPTVDKRGRECVMEELLYALTADRKENPS